MRSLARVLEAIQRLVDQRDEEPTEAEAEGGVAGAALPSRAALPGAASRALRLIRIKDSSAAYAVAAPLPGVAVQLVADAGKGLAAPSKHEWSWATLSALRELSETAKSVGCEIELRLPGSGRQHGKLLARVTAGTFGEVSADAFITGHTSVYATLERVGGATEMHCGLRVPDQPNKMVICRVATTELVRSLGQYLYQNLLVSGEATWLRHNWQLKGMLVTSFEPPKTGSIKEALNRVYEAGGRAWDRIKDPEAAVAEMRG